MLAEAVAILVIGMAAAAKVTIGCLMKKHWASDELLQRKSTYGMC
jgi:hypothetical protein